MNKELGKNRNGGGKAGRRMIVYTVVSTCTIPFVLNPQKDNKQTLSDPGIREMLNKFDSENYPEVRQYINQGVNVDLMVSDDFKEFNSNQD